MTPDKIEEFLPIAKELGLAGMETRYSLYDDKTEKLAVSYANRFALSESGGSNFHGMNKPDISLGTSKGNLFV